MPIPVKVYVTTLRWPSTTVSIQLGRPIIDQMFRSITAIWRPAQVSFAVRSVEQRTIDMPRGTPPHITDNAFRLLESELIDGDRTTVKAALSSNTPNNQRAGRSTIGGRFLLVSGMPSLPVPRRANIFAHELGHVLGLPDFTIEVGPRTTAEEMEAYRNNLMASVVSDQRTLLTPEQIRRVGRSSLTPRGTSPP
jgi:hypothetical protein